jgi:hypothetical protein
VRNDSRVVRKRAKNLEHDTAQAMIALAALLAGAKLRDT